MSEKQSSFTVTDRRKFTLDGELRDPSSSAPEEEVHDVPPPPSAPLPSPAQSTAASEALEVDPDALDGDGTEESDDELGPIPTQQESADQHAEYRKSSGQLDDMIRQANPAAPLAGQVNFEEVVQSFYLSAVLAMGAAAEPGQKPRVDIIGARQSIDMLAVLVEKTKGNLNDREQKLIQTAIFNLRMMFLEITNSIAAQAGKAPKPGPPR